MKNVNMVISVLGSSKIATIIVFAFLLMGCSNGNTNTNTNAVVNAIDYVYFSDLNDNYDSPNANTNTNTNTNTQPVGTTDGTTTTQFTDMFGDTENNDDNHDDHDHEENESILFTKVYEFSHSADDVCHCDGTRPHCPNPEDEATFVCDDENDGDESSSIQLTGIVYDDDDFDSHKNHDDHGHEHSEVNENKSASSHSDNNDKKISPWIGLVVFLIVVLLIIVSLCVFLLRYNALSFVYFPYQLTPTLTILICNFKVQKRRHQEVTEEENDDSMKKKNKKDPNFDNNIDNNDTSESENEIDESEHETENESENENDIQRMKKIIVVDVVDDGKTIDSTQNYDPMQRDDIECADCDSVISVYELTSEDVDHTRRTSNYHPRSSSSSQRGQRRNSTVVPVADFDASSTTPPSSPRRGTTPARTTMVEKYEAWVDGNLKRQHDKLINGMMREDP